MRKRYFKFLISSFFVIGATFATAQEAPMDVVGKSIVSAFQTGNAKVLCLNSDSSLPVIRKSVEVYLSEHSVEPSAEVVTKAVYSLFPCPFSPYRTELRPATAKDIEGVWLYPEASQKLRFGPQSPMWTKLATPVKCEVVAYYPGGEYRNAQATGLMPCPFSNAKNMDASRLNPRVISWKIIRGGIVKIFRTDVQDHIEEWEVFTVDKSFEMAGVQFNAGDLITYLRRERGNDFNVATVFRHLQRLP
ncbi:hypothetical protein BCF11_3316 [Collimonas sp. PA-H2]|uniref:hypothetical protein n=1 Tax=Collimonas sp. PA-H2 TaxID=1881062 RepID=UPI000C002CF2|nr:hypothetical protein [Collimonas sp. PA-H2]PFH10882.1 hypothetical protein BCF11_3316 [Collimonas sp. PA-H2]